MSLIRVASLNKNDRINPRKVVLPVYPPAAAANGLQDVVIVEFTVLADGTVADTRIVRSVPGLDAAAIEQCGGGSSRPSTRWELPSNNARPSRCSSRCKPKASDDHTPP